MNARAPEKFSGCPVIKIVSGGQTGVDRAALDAAIRLDIAHGGWCPKGRLAEDGPIPAMYGMSESDSPDYAARTERNVMDSDGTLIVYRDRLQSGTLLTNRLAKHHGKPLMRVRLDQDPDLGEIRRWLIDSSIRVLNVAGPRASLQPTIYDESLRLLVELFTAKLSRDLLSDAEASEDLT